MSFVNMIELLAPAGDFEKLKMAIHYGADAVYAGGENFSLRERSGNFSMPELAEAVKYTHRAGKKIYVAVNIYAHNRDIEILPPYLKDLHNAGIDGIILSDPGILMMVKEIMPGVDIHMSTQANTTNYKSVQFWQALGVSRFVLARELSLEEIKEIREKTTAEIEVFVHGAQCMAYSGRCLISNYLADRGANQGDCAQSCRWNYSLVEEKRPGEFHEVEEDSRGTYFFNSKDLALIEHIPQLIEAGVHSVKIEGRVKSIHYTSTVVRAYREAIDSYYTDKEINAGKRYFRELKKISHRDYSTGFFFGNPGAAGQSYDSSRPSKGFTFLGKIIKTEGNEAWIEIKGKFSIGDTIEVMRRQIKDDFIYTIDAIFDEKGSPIEFVKPNTISRVIFDRAVSENDLVRLYEEINVLDQEMLSV